MMGRHLILKQTGDICKYFADNYSKECVNTVLEAVQLPACVANLAAGLAHVDGDAFSLNMDMVSTNVI